MTDEEIKRDALSKHPDCNYAVVIPGIDDKLNLCRIAILWPDEHSFIVHNLPKYKIEGYPPYDGDGKGRKIEF